MPKHETQNTYYKINFSLKNYMKNVAWETSPRPFLIFEESSVKRF